MDHWLWSSCSTPGNEVCCFCWREFWTWKAFSTSYTYDPDAMLLPHAFLMCRKCSGCFLTGPLPPDFGKMTALNTLWASYTVRRHWSAWCSIGHGRVQTSSIVFSQYCALVHFPISWLECNEHHRDLSYNNLSGPASIVLSLTRLTSLWELLTQWN